MAEFGFTRKTFAYFDGAKKNATDREWFDARRMIYAEHVEAPFEALILALRERLGSELPGVVFSARRISKPVIRANRSEEGRVLRHSAFALFAETSTSMFEDNPGIYLSIGAKPDDNVVGCGLYTPSARQMRELRPVLANNPAPLTELLKARRFRKHWNGLSGERFTRFPKGFAEDALGASYLWHKQFYVGRQLSRDEVMEPGFAEKIVDALAAAVPFLQWTRATVGVWKRPIAAEEDWI